ncbi:MAG: phosphoribosylanthranilate isomerase [Candidatus Sumerlaeia bacterium]|nr:phosphoribosylanthranilate isomerase [Candidatus Sumerlaeia bacterium]
MTFAPDRPHHVKVKICGLTRREDAELATRLGADYLGLVFAPKSPRRVTAGQAAQVLDFAPRPPAIGVFVDAGVEEIIEISRRANLQGVQLHGDEEPDVVYDLPGFRIKAFRVRDEASLARVDEYHTEAILCDTFVEGAEGGTGRTFDHGLVVDLARRRWVFLAGGLTPDNVAEAAARVQPYAVDVSSGVEAAPGVKDPARLEFFFASLRAAGLR